MPKYTINGVTFNSDRELTVQDLEALSAQTMPAGNKAAAPATPQPQQQAPGIVEQMFGMGSPIARFAKGAVVDPLLGINQILANTGLFGQGVKQGANQLVQQYEKATEEARGRVGSTGIDVAELGGAILSPANKIGQAAQAATRLGRVAQTAGQGAVAGLLSPTAQATSEEEYVMSKLKQAGLGAGIGGAFSVAGQGADKAWNIIRDLPISAEAKQRALQKYLGGMIPEGKTQEVTTALRQAGEIVLGSRATAGEALAETPAGVGLIKEQARVAKGEQASNFLERSKEQQQARMQSLTDVFGDDKALADLIAKRKEITTPMREKALAEANVYGEVGVPLEREIANKQASLAYALQGQGKTATEAAQAIERANNWSPVAGFPQFPGRYSPNMERAAEFKTAAYDFGDVARIRRAELDFSKNQLQELKDQGYYPLDSVNIIDRLEKVLRTPGERSNDILVSASRGLIDKLKGLTDKNGIINSVDLYNVRKDIAADIAGFLNQKNMPFGAEAAKVDKALKNILDAAINKASGSDLWSNYLKEFAAYSKKIDQAETGKLLRMKLGEGSLGDVEKAGSFASAVLNAPSTIKRATGTQRYKEIGELLTEDQGRAVNAVLADLSRAKKADELAKSVTANRGPLADTGVELPQFLDSKVTIFRSIIRTLKTGSQTELDGKIAQLMLNPQDLALFIETLPKKYTKTIAESMMGKMSPDVAAQFRQVLDTTNVTRGVTQQVTGEL
jgi:hypothetical protein